MSSSTGVVLTPNEGELDIGEALSAMTLEVWLATAITGGYSEETELADIVEPSTSGTGYARRTLTGGTATTTPGDPTRTVYPSVEEWVLDTGVDPITHIVLVNPGTGRIRHVIPLTPAFVPDGETPLALSPGWSQS